MSFGHLSKFQAALDAFEKPETLAKNLQEGTFFHELQINIAHMNYPLGNLDIAKQCALNAINYFEKIGAEYIVGHAYNMLGIIYGRSKEHDVSLYYHTLTQVLNRRMGDVFAMGSTAANMGISNKNMGNHAEAHRHYRDAETIFAEKEILYGVAFVCVNRALLEVLEERYVEAIAFNQRAADLGDKLGISALYVHVSNGLARVALAMQQFERSAEFIYPVLNSTSEDANAKKEAQEILASLREHLNDGRLTSIEAHFKEVSDDQLLAMIRVGIPT